ncbi:hypothetical protein C0585_01425 [Candidatus Woesearchaeota archaeon]|nr:MAG: hypothetical protein C0585_01425 [Candidatus Woesearchaeota archaeon]
MKKLDLGKFSIILALTSFFLVSFSFGAITEKVFFENDDISFVDITGNVVDLGIDEEIPSEIDYSREKPSPADWISESRIKVYNDRVVILIDNPEWARFTDTNSMDPVFDEDSNAIEIVPKSPNEINVGDIVSFQYGEDTIIHRVIKTDYDEEGWYMITKGDNNQKADPTKIRFEQVRRLVVAIIY